MKFFLSTNKNNSEKEALIVSFDMNASPTYHTGVVCCVCNQQGYELFMLVTSSDSSDSAIIKPEIFELKCLNILEKSKISSTAIQIVSSKIKAEKIAK